MKRRSQRLNSLTEEYGGVGDATLSEYSRDSSVEAGPPEVTELRDRHIHHRGLILVDEEGRHAQYGEVERKPYVVAIAVGFQLDPERILFSAQCG